MVSTVAPYPRSGPLCSLGVSLGFSQQKVSVTGAAVKADPFNSTSKRHRSFQQAGNCFTGAGSRQVLLRSDDTVGTYLLD